MGLANNIHYVGAVTSNVPFNEASEEAWRNDTGEVPASGEHANKSYLEVKQSYIDQYKKDKDEATFQKRNEGTAKNMIGIASGYALKIQNVQELYDANKKIVDKIYYGPIYGVIEMNLIDVREDEGGGYVYADNVHKRDNGNNPDFLETTGNFVFPYDAKQNRYIVDDCFPTGFYGLKTNDPDSEIDVHYWYVTGFNYYYNAHITGFTYKDAMKFNNDNSDGLTVLAGLKPNQPVTVHSWKMPELVLKFLNELTVLRHFARDEFHILFNLACLVGAFTILHDVHSVFSLINFSEALLNLVECAHHVVDFIIALCNNTLQTVGLGHTLYRRSFALTIAASQKQCSCHGKKDNFSHNYSCFESLVFFPATTMTISPFGGVCVKWSTNSFNVPLTLSSNIFDISLHTLACLSSPNTSANCCSAFTSL